MSFRIAFAGKGGTGKTTIASLLCRSLQARNIKPILAVDADPNSCLADKLGLRVARTIGALREELRARPEAKPAGISKNEWIERQINEALVESLGLDLLVMGRQEGPDCYCFINHLLREYLGRLGKQYAAVVIDNEAGLEHLSRRTDGSVDIMDLVRTLHLDIGACYLVLNQCAGPVPHAVMAQFQPTGLEPLALIPADPALAAGDVLGQSVGELPANAPAVVAVDGLVSVLLERSKR
ncbi:MAG: AAA family ATPase [Kiritimatiellaeota bacterium]|nr:AAA family ATPase [Kiritimatiellota bacterium]